jgi:hypothetical protein
MIAALPADTVLYASDPLATIKASDMTLVHSTNHKLSYKVNVRSSPTPSHSRKKVSEKLVLQYCESLTSVLLHSKLSVGMSMDPSKLKVVELRAELSSRGLDTRGVKATLIDRLKEALDREAG